MLYQTMETARAGWRTKQRLQLLVISSFLIHVCTNDTCRLGWLAGSMQMMVLTS
jgi:hypothetical protein